MNRGQVDMYDQIESYLDGHLDEEETHRFEQDLLKEEIAAIFREVLLMRELLGELQPAEPPKGLVNRIEAALVIAPAPQKESKMQSWEGSSGFWSAIKAGFRWSSYSISGMAGGTEALKSSVSGIHSIGYALGPLRPPLHKGIATIRQAGIPMWKSALTNLAKGVLP